MAQTEVTRMRLRRSIVALTAVVGGLATNPAPAASVELAFTDASVQTRCDND